MKETDKKYLCIGAYLDSTGAFLVRFNYQGAQFNVFKSHTFQGATSYADISREIIRLSKINDDQKNHRDFYIFSNFSESLKLYLRNSLYQEAKHYYVQTTDIDRNFSSAVCDFQNVEAEKRLIVCPGEGTLKNGIDILYKTKAKSRDDLSSLMSLTLLHSVGWLESKRIERLSKARSMSV